MGSLTVHIWRGQTSAIARYARATRGYLMQEKRWDIDPAKQGTLSELPTTDTEVIKAAFLWWLGRDCPLFDWCHAINLPMGVWAPVVKDSVRTTIATDDDRLLSLVQTLSEYRGWLGRGSRIGVAVPPRATLAIVGEYMLQNLQPYHGTIVYKHPIVPGRFITVKSSTQKDASNG